MDTLSDQTREKYLVIYILHLNGLEIADIMVLMDCSQRTVYNAIDYGKSHLRSVFGDRLLKMADTKREQADRLRKRIRGLWRGNQTVITRWISGYESKYFGPPWKQRIITKPALNFAEAQKYFGKLDTLETMLSQFNEKST